MYWYARSRCSQRYFVSYLHFESPQFLKVTTDDHGARSHDQITTSWGGSTSSLFMRTTIHHHNDIISPPAPPWYYHLLPLLTPHYRMPWCCSSRSLVRPPPNKKHSVSGTAMNKCSYEQQGRRTVQARDLQFLFFPWYSSQFNSESVDLRAKFQFRKWCSSPCIISIEEVLSIFVAGIEQLSWIRMPLTPVDLLVLLMREVR